MGNKACTIAVQTEELSYAAGAKVNGRIYISVNDPNGVAARSLNLCFRGEEKVVIHYTTDEADNRSEHNTKHRHGHNNGINNLQTDHYERNTSPIFHLDEPIHSTRNGRLPKGQYEFPFQVIVPRFSPSSMRFQSYQSNCQIRYFIQAYLTSDGGPVHNNMFINPFAQNKFTSTKTSLEITGAQQLNKCVDGPIDIPLETQPVRKYCCINKGTMTLKSDVENDALIPNQTYYLNYGIKNDSTVSIQGVIILLEENIEFRAHHRAEQSKINLIKLYEDGNVIGNYEGEINQQLLPSIGRSRQVNLRIPRSAHSSHSGRLIEIYHRLHIIVKTECCISNPESCIEVSIIERPTEQLSHYTKQPEPSASFMEKDRPEPSAPFMDDEDDVVVEAMVLPDDWYPVTADVAQLPVATCIS